MAKDYFQDILPPQGSGRTSKSAAVRRDPDMRRTPHVAEKPAALRDLETDEDEIEIPEERADEVTPEVTPERSIRNISAPARRVREESNEPRYSIPMPRQRKPRRIWLWGIAVVCMAIIGVLLLIALRGTSVTVIPRSHTVVFDETSRFVAYPQQTAAKGTLAYTTQTIDLEDSEPVESSGTVHAEEKASGIVTIFNEFSPTSVKLIKNTRFQTADGLIFRAPADIVVPGKVGATAGQVSVTVVADQSGTQYNIAPMRLTVPGLKGGPEYDKVYGQVQAAFAGGFSGDRPGIDEGALAGARTAVRGRLEQKVRESITALSTDAVITFPEFAQIMYTDMPTTQEANNGARIHEKATALVPLLPSGDFALSVARTVSAEADNATVRIVGMKDFGGLLVAASSTPGVDPIQFQLTGQAMLIWQVNGAELAQALAGRDQSAFPTIVTGFPGIQSAKARIEPFWSSSFPSEAARIRVNITDPSISK